MLVNVLFSGWGLVEVLRDVDPESTFGASGVFLEAIFLPAAVAGQTAAVIALRNLYGVFFDTIFA